MFQFFHYVDFFLIKKFERFKDRVRFELETAIYNVLFK